MRQITTLSNGWLFTQMAQEAPPALLPQDWEEVTLPHTWNNLDGQDGGSDYYRAPAGTAARFRFLCRRTVGASILNFRAQTASARYISTGKRLRAMKAVFRPSVRILRPYLKADGENLLAVMTDNGSNDTVYPQMADFTFFGGLYRKVASLRCRRAISTSIITARRACA